MHLPGSCITASAGGLCYQHLCKEVHKDGPDLQHILKCQGTCKVLECSLLWNRQTMSNKITSGEYYLRFPYNHQVPQAFAWPHPIVRAIQSMGVNLCHFFKRNSKKYWMEKAHLWQDFLQAESPSLQIFIGDRAFVFLISPFSTKHRFVRVIIQLPDSISIRCSVSALFMNKNSC